MYIFTAVSLIYLADYCERKNRPVLWPSIVFLLIAVKSQSRTGTLIAFLLFLAVVFFNLKYIFKSFAIEYRTIKKKFSVVIALLLSVVVLFSAVITYQNSRFSTEKILSKSTVQRIDGYKSFFKELNIKKSITGFKPKIIKKKQLKHLHNSFLQLWSYAGFASIPAIAACFWMIFYYFKKSKFLTFILLLFFMYSMSEWVIFFRFADLVIFSLFIIAIRNQNEKNDGTFQFKNG